VDSSWQPATNSATSLGTKAVVIGASTGGPTALLEILKNLPTLSLPLLVAQHMPPQFVPEFAAYLTHNTEHVVEVGTQNAMITDGHVYVAPGDGDMRVMRDALDQCHLILVPPSAFLKPNIDVLMASVATVYGAGSLGVILTGMGTDGLEGMRAIKSVGGKTIVQDEATSAVYGMGQAVNEEHLADEVLPLSKIAAAISAWSALS